MSMIAKTTMRGPVVIEAQKPQRLSQEPRRTVYDSPNIDAEFFVYALENTTKNTYCSISGNCTARPVQSCSSGLRVRLLASCSSDSFSKLLFGRRVPQQHCGYGKRHVRQYCWEPPPRGHPTKPRALGLVWLSFVFEYQMTWQIHGSL